MGQFSRRKAWIVAADMGYGHQRAAYPLKDIAYQRIFSANSDKILSEEERKSWHKLRSFYENLSRLSSVHLIGKFLFWLYDHFQAISAYYPTRDLSRPSMGVHYFERLIRKKGLCNSIIKYIRTRNLPFVTTFHITAIAADLFGVKKIFCIVTDSDINRVWVAKDPRKSKIVYLAPCDRVVKRLREYGVSNKKIILTGFPLPKENTGNKSLKLLKKDIYRRLAVLDPDKIFYNKYRWTINRKLGIRRLAKVKDVPSLSFSVGGAGAQLGIAKHIMKSLKSALLKKKIKINLLVGMHFDFAEALRIYAKNNGLSKSLDKQLRIISEIDKRNYFSTFNKILRETDILWTKPSEMVFYTALGIPLIIAPPIGAHEHQNKEWLIDVGGGVEQKDIRYTNEWLFELILSGRLAEAAWNGFVDVENKGTYNIEKIVFQKQ